MREDLGVCQLAPKSTLTAVLGPTPSSAMVPQGDDGPDVRGGSGDILLVHATETDRKGTAAPAQSSPVVGAGGSPHPTEARTPLALVASPPALSGSELPSQCCWLTGGGTAGGQVALTQSQRLDTPAVSLSGCSVCR